MVKRELAADRRVTIALVGKYTQLHDAYLSVVESLHHAGTANDAVVDIRWVDSETLTEANTAERLAGCAGILVPGGFGDRGIEGMIAACRYAREHQVPYFGICLGMQMAVVEFARHVLGLEDANSSEFAVTKHPVIDLMPDQVNVTDKGRHHAPGPLSRAAWRRAAASRERDGLMRSPSATVTAMSSTTITAPLCRRRA